MKKTYMKPEIMFDDFSLNTNISAGCEIITDNQSKNSCAYLFGRDQNPVFSYSIAACVYKENPDEEYDDICYHVPSDNNNLFNS